MVVKVIISGGVSKTVNKVYMEMINAYKYKEFYNSLYKNFIKDVIGMKNIKEVTSNDIDYFYAYLKNKTHNGHFYSNSYIKKIMNLLKKIFDYAIEKKYINTNLVEIKLYFIKNID